MAGLAGTPCLAVVAAIALLLAGVSPPAAGMCTPGDPLFYEVEIESCEPARRRAEELLAESCRGEIANSFTWNVIAADLEKKGVTAISLGYRRWADRAIPKAEKLAENFRESSAYFVVATTRILRIGRVARRQNEAVWETPDTQPLREMMIHADSEPNACAKVAGQRVVLEISTPCCDFNPNEVLTCVLGLELGKIVATTPAPANSEKP